MSLSPADPAYRRCLRAANAIRRRRVAEISVMYGNWMSSGTAAAFASWALALAASRFCYELGGEKGDVKLMKLGADLADKARSAELTAVDLAEREASTIRERKAEGVNAHADLLKALAQPRAVLAEGSATDGAEEPER